MENVCSLASLGLVEDEIDIDTPEVHYPTIRPGDVSARVDLSNGTDFWNLVYITLPYYSEITSRAPLLT